MLMRFITQLLIFHCLLLQMLNILDNVLQVLSDDEKRSLYDKFGEAGLKGAGMGTGVSLRLSLF